MTHRLSAAPALDSLSNLAASLNAGKDKQGGDAFFIAELARDQIESMYRGDWLARKIVDIVPYDCVREWREWHGDPADVARIEALESRLNLRRAVQRAMVLGRLYGGGALIIGTRERDPAALASELLPEAVGPNGIVFLHAVSRWQLGVTETERDPLSPWFGEPKAYEVTAPERGALTLHPSRVIRFLGSPLPDPGLFGANLWSDSVLTALYDAIHAVALTTTGATSLMHEAKVDVVTVPNLSEHLSNAATTAQLSSRFAYAATMKSINNLLLLGDGETWARERIDFGGLPAMVQTFLQVAAGAADIPVTRLLGQSPAGLSATGQTQMADWIAPLIGFQKPFNPQRANLARLGSPTAPYTIYPREVEDPAFYTTIIAGQWLGQGTVSSNDYLDITAPGARYKEILPGDIVQMGFAGPVWQIPFTAQLYNLNANTIRIGSLGTGLLPVIAGGPITVYRNRFEWDATIQSYAQQANAYPYARRFYCPAAGSGYLRLYPVAQNVRDPANMLLNPNTDVIVPPGGFGAITGYTTLPFSTAGTWQVSKTGTDFTSLAGKYIWVFSTTPQREQIENNFDAVRLDITGALSATYYRRLCTRGGKVNKVLYTQGTAGTSDMTITLKANGTQVVQFVVTAGHTTIQTTTWASGTSFWTYPGWVLEWSISGGAGAADIAVALDIANS